MSLEKSARMETSGPNFVEGDIALRGERGGGLYSSSMGRARNVSGCLRGEVWEKADCERVYGSLKFVGVGVT
jgi:hypothetical protein